MVERGARAIGAVPSWDGDTFAHYHTREELNAAALAVIKAMGEPTPGMVAEGFDAIRMEEKWPTLIGRIWNAMIQAAINDAGEMGNG